MLVLVTTCEDEVNVWTQGLKRRSLDIIVNNNMLTHAFQPPNVSRLIRRASSVIVPSLSRSHAFGCKGRDSEYATENKIGSLFAQGLQYLVLTMANV